MTPAPTTEAAALDVACDLADFLAENEVENAGSLAGRAVAGPLAPLLAELTGAKAALDEFEPLIGSLPAACPDAGLRERIEAIAREAIDGREGERRLAEHAGITLGVTAADDPAALVDALKAEAVCARDLEDAAAAARAGIDRLRAERDERERAMLLLLAFADRAASEEWEIEAEGGRPRVDAIELCGAAAAALGMELVDPEYGALVARADQAVAALARPELRKDAL